MSSNYVYFVSAPIFNKNWKKFIKNLEELHLSSQKLYGSFPVLDFKTDWFQADK